MVPTILVIVVIVAVGVGVLAYRNRSEKGIESGITSFRRELHALAPREGARPEPTLDSEAAEADDSTADSADDAGDEPAGDGGDDD